MTSGISMYSGWPSMLASASIPPTPQPSTPSPLIIVVWLSVPTSVSGIATGPVGSSLESQRRLGQVLQIDLVNDADVRRDDAEVVERLLAPTQELVAFAVAFEFDLDILRQRSVRCQRSRLEPSGRSPSRPGSAD